MDNKHYIHSNRIYICEFCGREIQAFEVYSNRYGHTCCINCQKDFLEDEYAHTDDEVLGWERAEMRELEYYRGGM